MSRFVDVEYILVEAENVFSDMKDFEWLKRILENPNAPSIEPKRGELIERALGYECSACHESYDDEITFFATLNFCPNCGAKMK